jgi:ribonucleotide monophosphatase NagD (HAD superfamily)
MIEYLEQKYGMDRSRICMVGDRLDTDVLFGNDNGLKSVLVLSGVTSEEKLLSPDNTITPDYYAARSMTFLSTCQSRRKRRLI